MRYDTELGKPVDGEMVEAYFKTLVNHFFKILPIRENEEGSLAVYVRGMQVELEGFRSFVPAIRNNPDFLRLLSILQYLMDHPDCETKEVKREVFQCISLINRLQRTFERDGDRK